MSRSRVYFAFSFDSYLDKRLLAVLYAQEKKSKLDSSILLLSYERECARTMCICVRMSKLLKLGIKRIDKGQISIVYEGDVSSVSPLSERMTRGEHSKRQLRNLIGK